MPQMMPINWMISFFFFICVFILFNILNYYIFNLKTNNMNINNNKIPTKNFNWKW
uniref:ATP synthase complex subunit 8 n=1 Tax=Grapholita delineana TaxID=1178106 RepID=A0A8F4MG85_9NEOP|nr:ATP synthase F0 subunit 8 [Grapholita delineana]UDU84764.1 ATP synthase F0 subunit 8 [Grapholita delineana]UDU84790.1 ATP synthase F0 subunit 8 [Grapholita delineana]UDU84803.1 ATP synthase F0 subunit 8 [Grapholita delineana]UDU84816.1 ATP synthase F0 subunit 8 [Grapholita delineana]